jgi:hypothetical protein
VRQQLQDSELTYKAREMLNDSLQALQDPKTRQAALDALESTGIPSRARGLVHDGSQRVQNLTHEQAQQLADFYDHQAKQFPDQFTHLVQKPKQKRFIFA